MTENGPIDTCGPSTEWAPTRAVGSTPGVGAFSGYSSRMTRTSAPYGSDTTIRVLGPDPLARSSGTRTAPARELPRSAAYRLEVANERLSGPARSSGRMLRRQTLPSPNRRPPTRSATACAVRLCGVTRLAARFELLNDALSEIQRFICRNDAVVGGAHIEDHGVVPCGADAFDDAVDLALDRIQQLTFTGSRLLLQLLGSLLQLLLLGLQILPLCGALGGAQHDGLLVEVRCSRIQAGLQLLDLDPIVGELLGKGRLRLDVPGCLFEDRLGIHKGNLRGTLLRGERPGSHRQYSVQSHPDSPDDKLHASLPMKGRTA